MNHNNKSDFEFLCFIELQHQTLVIIINEPDIV